MIHARVQTVATRWQTWLSLATGTVAVWYLVSLFRGTVAVTLHDLFDSVGGGLVSDPDLAYALVGALVGLGFPVSISCLFCAFGLFHANGAVIVELPPSTDGGET